MCSVVPTSYKTSPKLPVVVQKVVLFIQQQIEMHTAAITLLSKKPEFLINAIYLT